MTAIKGDTRARPPRRGGRPRPAAVLAALVAAAGLAPGPLASRPEARVNIRGESRILTADPAPQIEPAISGDIVVYTDLRNGNADIYFYDLAAEREVRLTGAPQDEREPDISGRTIVYTDYGVSSGGGDIFAVAIGGGIVPVAVDPVSAQTNPAISGSLVVWEDSRDGNAEIYGRDLAAGVTRRLTATADAAESEPAVDGRRVVYTRAGADGECHVLLTDFDTGATAQISSGAACFRRPAISRDIVVYDGDPPDADNPQADLDVFVHFLETGEQMRIVLGLGQWNAHVSGPWISADKESNTPFPNLDVKLYNIPNTFPFGAVITEFNESANDIDRRRAVYGTDENGNPDIGLYEFIVGDNRAPVADAGPDRVVECARPSGTAVGLDGSGSFDEDQDIITFTWTGPFPEGSGTQTGVDPTVTLPLGGSSISLVVDDAQDVSAPDTVSITVAVRAEGLRPALLGLVPEDQPVPLPGRAARRGSVLALRLRLACGDEALTDAEVSAPRIVGLERDGVPVDLDGVDLAVGASGVGGLSFRSAGDQWFLALSTRHLEPGTYTLRVETPDGLRHAAAFILR
ncbi:MAG: hypothetical protein ACE5JH_09160 [Acidobacteriota bacterium]